MEDGSSSSGGDNDSSSKNTIARTSEQTIHINIKTLNSNVFTLQVGEKVLCFYNLFIFALTMSLQITTFFLLLSSYKIMNVVFIYFSNLTLLCTEI